jgi:hypothetical protein
MRKFMITSCATLIVIGTCADHAYANRQSLLSANDYADEGTLSAPIAPAYSTGFAEQDNVKKIDWNMPIIEAGLLCELTCVG